MHGCKTHMGRTWFSIRKLWCSPHISFFDVALDNNLVSLISHCILIWTFYEGWIMDSLVVVVLVVLVPFLLWYLTLAMATLHFLKPCKTPGLVKLSLLWDWDGKLPKSKHRTHKNRKTSTWALVQRRSKNTNHFRGLACLNAYFVKEEPSILEADGNCGGQPCCFTPPQPLKRPSQIPFVTQTSSQARQVFITHKILRIPPTPSNVFWRWPNNRVNEAVQHHMVRTRLRTHSPYHLLYNSIHGNEMFSRTSHTKMSSLLNLNLTSNPNTRLRCKLTDAYQERGASK